MGAGRIFALSLVAAIGLWLRRTLQRWEGYNHTVITRSPETSGRRGNLTLTWGFVFSPSMAKGGYVYLMASPNRGSVYVGMTSDIKKRVWEHKNKVYPECYTARYNCVVLVYYKEFYEVTEAIVEEKRIKKRNRPAKERLIDSINPDWEDLYGEVLHKF